MDEPLVDSPVLTPLPTLVTERYPSDLDGLFARIRSEVDDEMLDVIAACDYGEAFEENRIGLEKIRRGIDLDVPMGWQPNEVLSLFRWSTFDHESKIADFRRFHVARTFCCCALLRIPDHVENRTLYDPDTLVQLVLSCVALGKTYRNGLIRQIAWHLPKIPTNSGEVLFSLFAITYLIALDVPTLRSEAGEWFLGNHEAVLDWLRREDGHDAATFVDLPSGVLHPERYRSLARELAALIDSSSPFRRFLAVASGERDGRSPSAQASS